MAKKKTAKKSVIKQKPKSKAKSKTQAKAAKPKAKKKDMTRWANVPAKVVLAAAELCDGHSIMIPAALRKVGVPKELVAAHTRVFKSDFNDPKSTIFDNKTGKPVKEMKGVYGLEVLDDIVRQLNLPCKDFFGRGSQAREYQRVITEHFATAGQLLD